MPTSRQDFTAFLKDFGSGVLGWDHVTGTPARPTTHPNGFVESEKPVLKFSQFQLWNQYRLILRGYFRTIMVITATILFAAIVDLAPPYVLMLSIDWYLLTSRFRLLRGYRRELLGSGLPNHRGIA
jgi:hypothetical protein